MPVLTSGCRRLKKKQPGKIAWSNCWRNAVLMIFITPCLNARRWATRRPFSTGFMAGRGVAGVVLPLLPAVITSLLDGHLLRASADGL